ncbi:hypothetical protein BD309DRAFT_973756 [Dichomitus squalens]|uniref:Uncharacterized protein n=1 Tax=Dichomitus squalens TaxID=114155 RepID=A0A4Q9N9U1_9APHY|nr:hypothetical protein BD311DRAFT_525338 [Dichomitus squalens]TBU37584.1 hypothetical protein BD309DRAFT_973756 [Dichomitus squalens]
MCHRQKESRRWAAPAAWQLAGACTTIDFRRAAMPKVQVKRTWRQLAKIARSVGGSCASPFSPSTKLLSKRNVDHESVLSW